MPSDGIEKKSHMRKGSDSDVDTAAGKAWFTVRSSPNGRVRPAALIRITGIGREEAIAIIEIGMRKGAATQVFVNLGN